ncbi:MAG: cytidine deaminase [candidate division WOR-3 bacterium]
MEDKLVKLAIEAKEKAYAPYSKFKVGAAILASGRFFIGFNIENASYSLTVCAERVAGINGIINGVRKFEKIAIASSGLNFSYPCGACLQFLGEFAEDMEVFLINGEAKIKKFTLSQLFPYRFSL